MMKIAESTKGLLRRAAAVGTTVAVSLSFAAGVVGVRPVWAADAVSYGSDYSVEHVLSDFQFFTENDLTTTCHTVGAVAVGGSGTLSDGYQGAAAAPYVNHLISVGDTKVSDWIAGVYSAYQKKYPFYYSTSDQDRSNSQQFQKVNNYIDFKTAFAQIQAESNQLSTAGTALSNSTDVTEKTLTIALNKDQDTRVTIPENVLQTIDHINLTGVSINDFANHQYVISFGGTKPITLHFNYYGGSTEREIGVLLNGKTFENDLSLMHMTAAESTQGGQINLHSGTKLIWNFPQATAVTTDTLEGHVVAPQALVKVNAGNFQGGVVAASAESNAEGHFFPYNSVPENPGQPSTSSTSSVSSASSTSSTSSVSSASSTSSTSSVSSASSTSSTSSVSSASSTSSTSSVSSAPSTSSTSSIPVHYTPGLPASVSSSSSDSSTASSQSSSSEVSAQPTRRDGSAASKTNSKETDSVLAASSHVAPLPDSIDCASGTVSTPVTAGTTSAVPANRATGDTSALPLAAGSAAAAAVFGAIVVLRKLRRA